MREISPRCIVETGTASGAMTSILLTALCRNGRGRLVSIDLPPVAGKLTMEETIMPHEVGFFVT